MSRSGDVPGFKEKLEKGMMNFFRRIKPEAPVLRNNYFIQVDDDLAWSTSIGSEDCGGISWDTAEKNKAVEHHYFRSERQSLRRCVGLLHLYFPAMLLTRALQTASVGWRRLHHQDLLPSHH